METWAMISVTQSITKAGKKENGLLLYNLSKDNIATNDKFLSRLYSSAQVLSQQQAIYAKKKWEKREI